MIRRSQGRLEKCHSSVCFLQFDFQHRCGTYDEHEMKEVSSQLPRPHGDAPLVLRYEARSVFGSSKSVKFPLLFSNTRSGSAQTLHQFNRKSQKAEAW